ncbi:hypothetical protein [Kouleothrix sp.]|uniref:hypothetical protein n=1 Tax=Kouleothrix sp. TaxID=2779161 RepID=UPI00391A8A33
MLKFFYRLLLLALALVAFAGCSAQQPAASRATPLAAAPTAAPPTAAPATAAPPTAVPPTAAPPTEAVPTAAPATAAPASGTGGPRFTHPTAISNPLYPIALTRYTIALGTEGGDPSRTEITLLPGTRVIAWNGQQTEVRVVQFMAMVGGRLVEVAYDYFAQADDGSVYYMGEDVTNYRDGKVADHGGSWQAGKDGAPPALIMPARPSVGQVFNPENLPGVVFETDKVLSLGQKTTTPAGPIDNGVFVEETLMDGSVEHKIYAANFGIVEEQASDELSHLVLYAPAGAPPRAVPDALSTIEAQAEDIADAVPGGSWAKVSADVDAARAAWQGYAGEHDGVPAPFRDALAGALARLQKAAAGKQPRATLQAANDLSAAVVDLFAVYQPALPPDLGWLDVLGRQVKLDVAASDYAAAADSLAKAGAVWARLKPVVLAHDGAGVAAKFDGSLAALQKALAGKNSAALEREAEHALALVDALEGLF